MAQLLIESMESDWDPERYHDTHREKVEALIEEKRSGHEIVLQAEPEAPAKVVDLMEALNASIAAAARPEGKSTKEQAGGQARPRRAGPPRPPEAGEEGGEATGPDQDGGPPQGLLSRWCGAGHPRPVALSQGPHVHCAYWTLPRMTSVSELI